MSSVVLTKEGFRFAELRRPDNPDNYKDLDSSSHSRSFLSSEEGLELFSHYAYNQPSTEQ